jgi:hypothetical protein
MGDSIGRASHVRPTSTAGEPATHLGKIYEAWSAAMAHILEVHMVRLKPPLHGGRGGPGGIPVYSHEYQRFRLTQYYQRVQATSTQLPAHYEYQMNTEPPESAATDGGRRIS